ncbi:MAG: hypothetical protein HQK56_16265 [Deltaproteobacteria bacterium]|nr:hypothetical protein [Deltaproteobacteria bacterium]
MKLKKIAFTIKTSEIKIRKTAAPKSKAFADRKKQSNVKACRGKISF